MKTIQTTILVLLLLVGVIGPAVVAAKVHQPNSIDDEDEEVYDDPEENSNEEEEGNGYGDLTLDSSGLVAALSDDFDWDREFDTTFPDAKLIFENEDVDPTELKIFPKMVDVVCTVLDYSELFSLDCALSLV